MEGSEVAQLRRQWKPHKKTSTDVSNKWDVEIRKIDEQRAIAMYYGRRGDHRRIMVYLDTFEGEHMLARAIWTARLGPVISIALILPGDEVWDRAQADWNRATPCATTRGRQWWEENAENTLNPLT